MIARTVTLVLAIVLYALPAQAQEDKSWRAFLDQLWVDAKAKGITRSTFDLAFQGVTTDPRVMPITKRQPEYGKPAGAYVNSIASPGRAADGLRKEKEWSK